MTTEDEISGNRLREVLESSPSELHKIRRARTSIDGNATLPKLALPDTTLKSSLMDSANDSRNSFLETPHNASAAEKLTVDFLHHIEEAIPRDLGSSADQDEIYRNFLLKCLRSYCLELKGEASSALEMEACRFIESQANRLVWATLSQSGHPLNERAERETVVHDEVVVDSLLDLAQAKQFLFYGPPFRSFLEQVSTPDWNDLVRSDGIEQDSPCSSLKEDNGWELYSLIRSKLEHSTRDAGGKIHQVNFIVKWEIENFIHEELDSASSLSEFFTVTGGAEDAYAGTSLEYVSKIWPRHGGKLLNVVHGLCQSSSPCEYTLNSEIDGRHLEVHFKRLGANKNGVDGFAKKEENDGSFSITISGSQTEVIDVAQQLAWMTASFRAGTDHKLKFSRTILSHMEETNCFRLEPATVSPIDYGYESRSCWHPLLLGSFIVQGFPIPREREGVRLEISFDLMFYLAGIRCPIMYKDGIVLKGDAHILVPTTHNLDFTQWHCLSTDSEDKTDLGLISKHCPDIAQITDFETFRQASRVFLGYYKKANVCLRTRDFDGEIMDLSGAVPVKSHWQLSRSFSLQLGFKFFIQINIASAMRFSKELRCTTEAKNILYGSELDRSRKQPLVLCDVATKRDWLVPELSIVLQIARTILLCRTDLDKRILETLPYARASPDGGLEALYAIRNGESLILRPGETFIDIIKQVMDALRTKNKDSSDADYKTLQKSSVLYGWELYDVIESSYIFYRRQIPINHKTAGSWPHDIARRSDILTFFCKNLRDPISPAADSEVCSTWVPLPEGKHYLAASMRCLSRVELPLRLKNDGEKNLQRVQRLKRHKTFDDCDLSTSHWCNRLQDFRAFKSSAHTINESNRDSAVILGNPFLYTPLKPCQRPQNANSNAGEGNTNATLQTSSEEPDYPNKLSITSASNVSENLSSSPLDTTASSMEISPQDDHSGTMLKKRAPLHCIPRPTRGRGWSGNSIGRAHDQSTRASY